MQDYQPFKTAITSQYHAALEMMRMAVEKCSGDLWIDSSFDNPTWRVVYHTLFFYRLYLYQHLDDHERWVHHRRGAHNMPSDPDGGEVTPYSKSEMLEFIKHCRDITDDHVQNLDLSSSDSGFHWYDVSKMEHQMVNLRHLQHHVAQLQDRIRNHQHEGISWVRSRGQIKL